MLNHEFINNQKAKTIIMIHGYLSHMGYWDRLLPYFGDDYNILRMDLPGHGKEREFKTDYTLKNYANLILELVNRYCPKDDIYLVGHSMGGYISAEFAYLDYPKLKRIGILNSPNIPNIGSEIKKWLISKKHSISRYSFELAKKAHEIPELKKAITRGFKRVEIDIDIEKYGLDRNPALIDIIFNIIDYDIEHKLSGISYPTLILSSSKDASVKPKSYKKLGEKQPHIFSKQLTGSWHHKYKDPEFVAKTILSFFA